MMTVGKLVGAPVGAAVGAAVGDWVGAAVGAAVGVTVGAGVGIMVGLAKHWFRSLSELVRAQICFSVQLGSHKNVGAPVGALVGDTRH